MDLVGFRYPEWGISLAVPPNSSNSLAQSTLELYYICQSSPKIKRLKLAR